jgi:hypothetical protein
MARAGAAPGTENLTEAQIKYQLAQKQAMGLKMSQAAQPNILASLLQNSRVDPATLAPLVAGLRGQDPATRQKAVQQLMSLLQKQPGSSSSPMNATPGSTAYQQQQFLAALQQRHAAQAAQVAAQQTQNQNTAAQVAAVTGSVGATQPGASGSGQQTTAQQLQQQQLLLQQQRAAQIAAQQSLGAGTGNATGATQPPAAPGAAARTPVWSGTITWNFKAGEGPPQSCKLERGYCKSERLTCQGSFLSTACC